VAWGAGDLKMGFAERSRHSAHIAAADSARVLRLPGFYNNKYSRRFLVQSETKSQAVYGPDSFPTYSEEERAHLCGAGRDATQQAKHNELTQSEKD
jgi:hypothetical protein